MVVAAAATSARRPIGKLFGFYRPLFDLRLLCRRLKHNFQCLCCVQSMMIVDINHLVVLPIRHLIRVWPCILLKRASICVQWCGQPLTYNIYPNICQNFDPFYSMEYDSMILKTHFISLWGVSKMHFLTPLLYRYLIVLGQGSSGSKEELGILVVGWKWLFWCQIHFRTHIIII